jgi:hypothetical protein
MVTDEIMSHFSLPSQDTFFCFMKQSIKSENHFLSSYLPCCALSIKNKFLYKNKFTENFIQYLLLPTQDGFFIYQSTYSGRFLY